MQLEMRRVFRADLHTYVAMTFIGGVPTVYGTWVALQKPAAWELTVVAAAFYVFLLVWTGTFRIEITDTELLFRSIIGGTKRIAHGEIQKIRLGIDFSGRGGILRLCVTTRNAEELSINAKVFSREAVRAVLDLGERVASADSGGLQNGVVARASGKRRSRPS